MSDCEILTEEMMNKFAPPTAQAPVVSKPQRSKDNLPTPTELIAWHPDKLQRVHEDVTKDKIDTEKKIRIIALKFNPLCPEHTTGSVNLIENMETGVGGFKDHHKSGENDHYIDIVKLLEPEWFVEGKKTQSECKQLIELPRNGRLISDFANDVIGVLKFKNILFFKSDIREIVEIRKIKLNKDSEESFTGFVNLRPSRFITLAEKYFVPFTYVKLKNGNFEEKEKSMNSDLANTLLCSEIMQSGLPIINRIFTVQMPIIYKEKLTFPKSGYDARFNSWMPLDAPIIENPDMTLDEAKEIIKLTLQEFCFETDQDKINAISALLTPFLRGLYSDFNTRTPVFFYIANRERAGKDYLAGITGIVYEGFALEEPPISTSDNAKTNNNEEFRKKMTSAALSNRKRLHFANNKGYINNAVFEMQITAKKICDRLLGKNENVEYDNEMEYSLSGNVGIGFTPDLANRCRFINLFLEMEDANARKFSNPNLHGWVAEKRGLILSALYALIRNWIENDSKAGSVPFASFPEWAEICGGIMEAAGYDSPCKSSTETLKIAGDSETADMKKLFELCFAKKNEKNKGWLTKDEIIDIVIKNELFENFDFKELSGKSKFGKKLLKFVRRRLSDILLLIDNVEQRGSRQKFLFCKNEEEKTQKNVFDDTFVGKVGSVGSVGSQSPTLTENVNNIITNRSSEIPAKPAKPAISEQIKAQILDRLSFDGAQTDYKIAVDILSSIPEREQNNYNIRDMTELVESLRGVANG
ncbi:MAG: hypothetical protein KKB09_07190 [Nanoarchaeota archaeon]|nr:hypothetical protein [Nanoarchaeota archaeon]